VWEFYAASKSRSERKGKFASVRSVQEQGAEAGGGQTHPGAVGIFNWSSDGLTASGRYALRDRLSWQQVAVNPVAIDGGAVLAVVQFGGTEWWVPVSSRCGGVLGLANRSAVEGGWKREAHKRKPWNPRIFHRLRTWKCWQPGH